MSADERVVRDLFRRHVHERPDAKLVKCGGDWITYGQMASRVDRLAVGLASLGVTKGDRVGVMADNREELFTILLACAQVGAIHVSFNSFLKGDFLKYQLDDSGTSVFIVDAAGWSAARAFVDATPVRHVILLDSDSDSEQDAPGRVHVCAYDEATSVEGVVPDPPIDPRDQLAILYTSGTTGDPKGCMLSNGYYTNVPQAYFAAGRLEPGDRVFTAFPFFHTAGQVIVFMSALYGPVEVVFEQAFHASTFMQRASEEGATVLWGVGAMGLAILAQPHSPEDSRRSLRLAQFQPMSPERQVEFEERFNTPMLTEGYGQTECVPITASRLSDERHRASIGRPVDHLDVAIVDDNDIPVERGEIGEIVVRPRRPDVMFSGYWNKPEATLKTMRNLWHHTGDYARMDEDGFIYFVDRKSESLRRRGENISSVAVESTLVQHPAISNAAVVGVPSELIEDDIKACIVLHDGHDLPIEELFEFMKDRLPYFAVPRYVEFVDELPTNPLGKLMKHQLRAQGVTASTVDLDALGLKIERSERRGSGVGRIGVR